jgi:hypothetical protein
MCFLRSVAFGQISIRRSCLDIPVGRRLPFASYLACVAVHIVYLNHQCRYPIPPSQLVKSTFLGRAVPLHCIGEGLCCSMSECVSCICFTPARSRSSFETLFCIVHVSFPFLKHFRILIQLSPPSKRASSIPNPIINTSLYLTIWYEQRSARTNKTPGGLVRTYSLHHVRLSLRWLRPQRRVRPRAT